MEVLDLQCNEKLKTEHGTHMPETFWAYIPYKKLLVLSKLVLRVPIKFGSTNIYDRWTIGPMHENGMALTLEKPD